MLNAPAYRGGNLLASLDLLPTGIAVFASDHRLAYCNSAFRELRGLPGPLCRRGTPLHDIIRFIANRGDYGPGDVEQQVERCLAELVAFDPEQVEQDCSGGRRLLIRHTPTADGGLLITYSDVAEARETERKLRENEERYGLASQAVAEGIYDWNVEDNTLFVSPRLMEIFGFEGPGLSSQNWFSLVHEADREGYRDALRSCFRGEAPRVDCEYRILVRSGEYRWVEDHGLPVRNSASRAIRLVGAVSDVTPRKETERALRDSEQRYELALQAVNESVYEWDIVTGTIYYSPRLYATLGLRPDELRTVDDWLQRIHPDDLTLHRDATRAHLKGDTERLQVEYRYRHSDRTWHWARQHGLALRDASGRAVRVTGSTGDITAEKRMQDELAARAQELADALERQTATSEVLQVINASQGNLAPVFEAMLAKATQLCNATLGILWTYDGEAFTLAADLGTPSPNGVFGDKPLRAGPDTGLGQMAREKRVVHIPDVIDDLYRAGDPVRVITVEKLRARTWIGVPLLKEGTVIGAFTIYRGEVRPFTDKEIALLTSFADQAVIAIENVRLFEEVQARTRELQESLLYQTGSGNILRVIASSPTDVRPALEAIAQNAYELCAAQDVAVVLRDGEDLRFSAHHGPIPIGLEKWPVNRRWTAGRAVVDGVPIHVHDLLAEGKEFPDGRELAVRMGHRSILSVPLLKDAESIGAIVLRRTEVKPFSEKQISLLQTFADQAVIAIENVHLFEQVQARTEELSEALQQQTATADVLKTISRSTFDLQTVLHTLVESAARLCDAEQASITRQRDGALYRAEFYGFSPEFIEHARRVPVEPDPGSVIGRALVHGEIVHIPDVQADPAYTWAEAKRLGGFRTILGIPMMREGVVIGVLTLGRSEPRPFTDKQIELVSTFADQAAIAIANVRLFEEVQTRTNELAQSLEELRAAQDRLVETQKLAALGQLTAGVAHEIKNPLNFINNFAELSSELIEELESALVPPLSEAAAAEAAELAATVRGNLRKVVEHGRRADSIVKNMLLHSREGSGERNAVDLNATAQDSLNLAYHGARAENPSFNVRLSTALDPNVGSLDAYPQELVRVLLNLISNAFHAVHKRQRDNGDPSFEPEVTLSTRALPNAVEIRVRDNGTGVPSEVRARMFDPFFTTKPPGEGTGLGLSLSHDIVVKQHGGKIDVDSSVGEFTEFVVTLPR